MAAKNQVVDRDRGFRSLIARARILAGGAYAKVGVLADSSRGGLHVVGPDGKAAPLTVAEIAAVQEFGTVDGRIPSRSFVRSTFDEQRAALEASSRRLIVAVVLDGTMGVEQALGILGLQLASKIREKITDGAGVPPPNAPSTLRRKLAKGAWNRNGQAQQNGQGPRPLVDTARMLGAIAWAVVIGDSQGEANYVGPPGGST